MKWSSGEILESSWASGQPATFPLNGVIAGWQQGLPGAKVGGSRLLVIPPALGYGPMAGHPLEKETLIFVVDIIAVS
jgi:peptidylprolyl isomerase